MFFEIAGEIIELIEIFLKYALLPLAVCVVSLGIAIKSSKTVSNAWFAWVFTRICQPQIKAEMDRLRAKVFVGLRSLKSRDPNLRNHGSIRVLEIGTGNGANFPYFPENVHYISVDPNPNFVPLLEQNKEKYKGIKVEKILAISAEDMEEIASDSVDAVVMTHVLCSVTCPKAVLGHVRRVLVKEGIVACHCICFLFDFSTGWQAVFR